MTRRFKAFLQNLLLLLGSILFTAIFVEIALRVVLPTPIVWKYPQEQYQFDAEIGHWLEPNQKAYTHDKLVSVNSLGLRDSDYPYEKSPSVLRVLALGDSQTFGNGLISEDTWPKQLEAKLNLSTDEKRVEVINAGLPGSDTWQHELILQRLVYKYQPDAVVLAFYVNDVVKRFTPNPKHQKADNELADRAGYLLKRSALLLTLRTVWGSVMQSPNRGALQQQALLKGEDSEELRARWDQVDSSFSNMQKIVKDHDVLFGLVLLPRRDQVDGRVPWQSYSSHLKTLADKYQISVVDANGVLQSAFETHGKNLFIPWDGHNSQIANEVISDAIVKEMPMFKQYSSMMRSQPASQ